MCWQPMEATYANTMQYNEKALKLGGLCAVHRKNCDLINLFIWLMNAASTWNK